MREVQQNVMLTRTKHAPNHYCTTPTRFITLTYCSNAKPRTPYYALSTRGLSVAMRRSPVVANCHLHRPRSAEQKVLWRKTRIGETSAAIHNPIWRCPCLTLAALAGRVLKPLPSLRLDFGASSVRRKVDRKTSILDEHYDGPRPAPSPGPRPKTAAEKQFCALRGAARPASVAPGAYCSNPCDPPCQGMRCPSMP
jgi:hypothetical protein